MKIGLINFHYAHNFGAILECMALSDFLKKIGHNVEVINYRPRYGTSQYAPYPSVLDYAKRAARDFAESNLIYRFYRVLRRSVQAITRYRSSSVRVRRTETFRKFQDEYIEQSEQYDTIADLRENPPKCDAYISGSDQIWNPYVTNAGLDPAYFLDFGDERIIRIAYAVSPCQLDVSKYENEIIHYLKRYDAISLRENQYQRELETILDRKIDVCIDPTLLLTAEDYEIYEEQLVNCPKQYILVYGFEDRADPDLLRNVILLIQKKSGFCVIDISSEKIGSLPNSVHVDAISPGEFLYYIKHASYVITNSFHGTAFSIVYRKNFWSVERKATASRMHELMVKSCLENRLVSTYDEKQILREIDTNLCFDDTDKYLDKERKHAKEFLNVLTCGVHRGDSNAR